MARAAYLGPVTTPQEQELKEKMAPEVYSPQELAAKMGKTAQWVRVNATKIPGNRETFPGSGRFVFLRRIVDTYYNW